MLASTVTASARTEPVNTALGVAVIIG